MFRLLKQKLTLLKELESKSEPRTSASGTEISQLKKDKEDLLNYAADCDAKIKTLETRITELETANQDLTTELNNKDGENRDLVKGLQEAEESADVLINQLNENIAINEQFEKEIDNLAVQNQTLRNEKDVLERDKGTIEKNWKELRSLAGTLGVLSADRLTLDEDKFRNYLREINKLREGNENLKKRKQSIGGWIRYLNWSS